MHHRILRLIAPLLIIATLLAWLAPNRAAGQSATAATFHTYLPLVSGGSGASAAQPAVNDDFTDVTWARTPYTNLAVGQVNGRTVARIRRYAQPTSYYDVTTDSWLPINTTLVADNGSYRNAAGSFRARFSAGGGAPLLSLGRDGEPSLAVTIPGASVPAPIVGTAVITYPAALGAASLVYRSETWGIKEEIVISAAGAPASYDLHISALGLTADRQSDGGYLLRNASGMALWRVPAPVGSD
ncbi:hypothetical protein EKD04_025440, partial [Chloroflexales bacterium ZM16-3]|nr:hypothetical protein [Chloroflexales bacterium ZM16-3]